MNTQQSPQAGNQSQNTSSFSMFSMSMSVAIAIILFAGASFWAYQRWGVTASVPQEGNENQGQVVAPETSGATQPGNASNAQPPAPQESSELSVYQNEDVTFYFPISWVQQPVLLRGSGFTQDFEDPSGKYEFSFSGTGNYSQVTGNSYATIDEFVNIQYQMPYQVKAVTVDGQDGRQLLPRAGSENVNRVVFFSKDSKFIYTLELKTGNTPSDTSQSDVDEGQRVFNQIIANFKFFHNSK